MIPTSKKKIYPRLSRLQEVYVELGLRGKNNMPNREELQVMTSWWHGCMAQFLKKPRTLTTRKYCVYFTSNININNNNNFINFITDIYKQHMNVCMPDTYIRSSCPYHSFGRMGIHPKTIIIPGWQQTWRRLICKNVESFLVSYSSIEIVAGEGQELGAVVGAG